MVTTEGERGRYGTFAHGVGARSGPSDVRVDESAHMVRNASEWCQTRSSTTSHELGGAVSSNDVHDARDRFEPSGGLLEASRVVGASDVVEVAPPGSSGALADRTSLEELDDLDDLEAHLTVAAVAARLGVAASTLRTWDRRYGLGPTQRQAGSHRRYSPDDLARLETMRALSLRGVALGDAARMALRSAPAAGATGQDLDPLTLAAAAAAVDSGHDRLLRALRASVVAVGLVETYTDRLLPALDLLADPSRSDAPGHDPRSALAAAFLGVVRERTAVPVPADGGDGLVLVSAPGSDVVAAHVVAGSLHEVGLRARVVSARGRVDVDRSRPDGVVLVVELHLTAGQDRSDTMVPSGHGLLLVGAHAPATAGAHRVRTLAAALPEAIDMARERLAAPA